VLSSVASQDPVVRATSLVDAVDALADAGDRGAPLAGGTWVMRSHLRGEKPKDVYVSLASVPELGGLSVDGGLRAGALATHADLSVLGGPLAVIGEAARSSAFPAVRNVATVGGNLAARPFPEADLVPALLAAEATVRVVSPRADASIGVDQYLASRESRPIGELIAEVAAPAPAGRRSAYERLTVRGGAEYAVASIAVSVDLDDDGVVRAARVALGSVEERSRLSDAAAGALVGARLDDAAAERCGRAAADGAVPGERLDAPAWYRTAVLPALARRAVGRILGEGGGA
jgi:aerobic carbon-monoxide dehydrogenase medium subunit